MGGRGSNSRGPFSEKDLKRGKGNVGKGAKPSKTQLQFSIKTLKKRQGEK